MTVFVFSECRDNLPAEHRQLFDDFGVEAYSIIYTMQMQEQEEEEQLAWDAIKPLRDDVDEEEDCEIDYGPCEPDTYGED